MKKILLLVILLLITGCHSKKMRCHLNISNKGQNYELSSEYVLYYKNNYVNKVSGYEKYNSNDKSVIDYYDVYLSKTYMDLKNNYTSVTYDKKISDNELTYNLIMNINEDVVKKMKKNKYIESDYVINNRITLTGMKTIYENKGYLCK